MADVGELIVRLRAESASFSTQMEQARRTTARTQDGLIRFSSEGTRGFRKIENAAASLGLGLIGLHGKAETLTSGLLMLGTGGQVTLLVTAGIAAIALAYESLTSAAHKARKENDDLVASLSKRLDANTGIGAELAAEYEKMRRLKHEIQDIQNRNPVQQALDPFGMFGGTAKLERLKAELAVSQAKIAEANPLFKQQWLKDHPKGITLIGPGQLDELKEALRVIAEAQSKLASTPIWISDLVKSQKESRGKNLTDSIMAGFDQAEGRTASIKRPEIFDKMEADAKFMEETWKNATRGIQDAFAQMFEDIGQRGFKLVSVLESIARAVQKSLAQIASKYLTDFIFHGFGSGGGIPGAPNVGNIGDSLPGGAPSISPSVARGGTTVHVHVAYTANAQAMDQTGVKQVLDQHGHLFVGKLLDAVGQSPNVARFIVAQGSR